MEQNNQPNQPTQPSYEPPVAPTPDQKVQYVITQNSLNGLNGWLLVYIIFFAFMGIGSIGLFFESMNGAIGNANTIVQLVFNPLLAAAFLGALVLIIMRKKAGIIASYAAFATLALYTAATTLTAPDNNETLPIQISGVVTAIIIYGLLALYFKQSRRVKETLTR